MNEADNNLSAFFILLQFLYLVITFKKKFMEIKEGDFSKSVKKQFKKRDEICSIGTIEKNVYLLKKGIVEAGMIVNGEERIMEFVLPGGYTSSFTSLLTQTPSDVYLKCLVDCEVQVVNYSDLRERAKTSLPASRLYIQSLESAYLERVAKEKSLFTQTAEERYEKLIETRPDIVRLIPIYRIAKYLGIHPDSLSRIRRLQQKKN